MPRGGLARRLEEARQRRDEITREQPREQIRREPEGIARRFAEQQQRQQQRNEERSLLPSISQRRERSPRYEIERGPRPPLPDVRPMATPVMDTKREAANFWRFSPEARTKLYDTPVRVNYRGYDNRPEGEQQGYYWPGNPDIDHDIMVQEPFGNRPNTVHSATGSVTWPSLSAGTLAHEFGHKWQHEELPPHLRDQWDRSGWLESSNVTPDLARQVHDDRRAGAGDAWNVMAGETYANNIMQDRTPGLAMPAWYRDKYYARLFNDSPREWQPPYYGGPAPTSDIIRERVPSERWPSASGVMG